MVGDCGSPRRRSPASCSSGVSVQERRRYWRSHGSVFGQNLFTAENLPSNVAVVERLKEVGSRLGVTVAQLALAWVMNNPTVSVSLVGARTAAEVRENLGALTVKFAQSDLVEIGEIMQGAVGQIQEIPT